MKKLLLSLAAVAMAAGAYAQIPDGQYCIRNIDKDLWLNCGHSWGTASVLKAEARVFDIVSKGNGQFQVKSSLGFIKGDGEYFLDGNEGDAVTFGVEMSDGAILIKHDNGYLAPNELYDFKDGDWWNWEKACHQDIQWTIKKVTNKDEAGKFEVISLADMKANLAKATPENPINATFMIKAHNMAKNDSENTTAWVYTKNGAVDKVPVPEPNWIYGNGDEWAHQDTYAFCINDKHEEGNTLPDSEDTVEQTVEGLPAGQYDVVYRVVNQNNSALDVDVNGTKCAPVDFTESDLWYHSAADAMKTGEKTQGVNVGQDGKLTIKMTKTAKAGEQNRFAFKSFKLFYKGNNGSGVQNIAIDDENAPVEYYNLQGLRVANPDKGLYIVRQGNKTSKVIL